MTDETVVVDVDLSAEVACTIKAKPPCPHPAVWLAVSRCCGDRGHHCDPHMTQRRRQYAPKPYVKVIIQCAGCGTRHDSLDSWMRVTPL